MGNNSATLLHNADNSDILQDELGDAENRMTVLLARRRRSSIKQAALMQLPATSSSSSYEPSEKTLSFIRHEIIEKIPAWSEACAVEDAELKKVTMTFLPKILAETSCPDAETADRRIHAFGSFAQWCRNFPNAVTLPACEDTVALYVVFLWRSLSCGGEEIVEAIEAIRWVHQVAALPDPTTDDCVTALATYAVIQKYEAAVSSAL